MMMKHKIAALVFVVMSSYAVVSHSASFDCKKAATPIEKQICGDALLGKLDSALSENYKNMLASDIGSGASKDMKATQKKWMASRNKCTDKQCLVEAYKKRMDEVCDYPVISGMHPDCTASQDVN